MTTEITSTEEKTVTLTLDELCEILCASAAKLTGVDEEAIDSYVEAFKKDYIPVVEFIYLRQQEQKANKKPSLELILP